MSQTSGSQSLTRKRPYLLRAMHEWILDNGMTPHIVVDAAHDGLLAPTEHAADGKLVLNISPTATRGLSLGNEMVAFEARFSGVSRRVEIPIDAVLGVYARENGHGMIFSDEDEPPSGPDEPGGQGQGAQGGDSKKPSLKVVK